ncbi:SRPBCC domain-containing protein [Flavitalea flava]
MQTDRIPISAETEINAPIEKVWKIWTTPEDIMQWNNMSDEWHNLKVENDLRPGGKFLFVMGLKDGSLQFDFSGTYDEVKNNELISYTLGDGRKSIITFIQGANPEKPVRLLETFQPENTQPVELQKEFCQAVLDSFRRYAEAQP